MEKYERVEKPRPEVPIMDNEIRIGTRGMPRKYVTHAITLLTERGASTVVLKALGNAISKAVTVAEIVKRRIPNLHHNTTISSDPVTYTWEPVEEGLLPLETVRHVSMITITLSTTKLDTSSTGYGPPLPVDQVKPILEYENEGEDSQFVSGRGRARGRGGRGGSSGNAQNGNGDFNDNSRGGHGRSRFGYDGNYNDNGFRRGQGRGKGRIGCNGEDGGEVASRGRGRGLGRARGRVGRN